MNQKYKTIDYEYLTCPVGDPFADVGSYVIQYLSGKEPEKDILQLIEATAKIYVNKWESKINTFFLNSPITQPAFKGEKKIQETINYFKSLLEETAEYEEGFCRISGKKTRLFKAGRDNSLLSGSSTFVNFHHSFQPGMMLSKEMLIRMFFIPYGCEFVGGKLGIIHSGIEEIDAFFVQKICENNDKALANSSSKGVYKSNYGIPANALFNFIEDLYTSELDLVTESPKNISLTFYHFTNFGASAEMNIYQLPSTVFKFYSLCLRPQLAEHWNKFLFAHYTNSRHKKAVFNENTLIYEEKNKNLLEPIHAEEYRTWNNVILNKLLNGKSILHNITNWGKKHEFNFIIIEQYQIMIRLMKKGTIDKIKELAQFLTENQDTPDIEKNITRINGLKSSYELRRFFLNRIVSKNYEDKAQNPIITVEELTEYLFPDTIFWKDVRDILLFAIYQNLHEKNIRIETLELEEETEN